MKAWFLSIKDDPDQGTNIVFANTRNEARGKADGYDYFYDTWLDIQARRAKRFDGLEELPVAQLHLRVWRELGWRWFDLDTPEPEETTDEEFLKWYEENVS